MDNDELTLGALDPSDLRSVTARVAGPAALLVAKAHKIHDRVAEGRPARLVDKDATDVVRLMRSTQADRVRRTLQQLSDDSVAGEVTQSALAYLEELFGRSRAAGVEVAARGLSPAMARETVEVICTSYVAGLRPGL